MSWLEDLGRVLGDATQSSFFKRLTKALQEELAQRQNAGQPLTPTQAQEVSTKLIRELTSLMPACDQQMKRLSSGLFSKPNSGTVIMSIHALSGITARLQAALNAYAAQTGTSDRWMPPAVDEGNTNPSMPRVPVPANPTNGAANTVQRTAEALRQTYQYAIDAARQICASIQGPNGANPYALDGAMAEVSVLVQVLQAAGPRMQDALSG